LVIIAGIPIVGAAGFIQLKVLTGFGEKTKKAYNEAGSVAVEAIQNIRTVIMLSKEQDFIKDYEEQIVYPHNVAIKGAYISSFAFGFSQGSIFFIYAVAFYYGSRLILWERSTSEDTLKVLFAIIFTAMSAGQTATFAPNFATAKIAANSVFNILDRNSLIDYSIGKGDKPDLDTIKGETTLTRGEFSYPTRPDVSVLNGMDVFAKPGETIALVGQSGCGKSTIIALMERFYHLSSGVASLDKTDVQQWELQYLRQQMALVGQEPVLFNISIRDSIAYGAVSGTGTNEEIEGVARMANIHEFIMSLPDGYDTLVGEKGGQLSGGQKQRIAIARALMRKPKLLLLDEATSALDSESEKVVQTALDAASKGRTTLVIAHRLSTIQNADHIFVVRNGTVIEHGKHFELLDKRGSYYELVNQQNLNNAKE
jgi:ATP-binding cassette subfamily B (MDR/TAP) protein 1